MALRVIQWATGNIGARSLRAIIDHPELQLAGVWVSAPAKAGRDAGTIAGGAPCGVTATGSTDEIVAMDADCVVHMANGTDIDTLCRLLASGKNVVTTRGDFHDPASLPGNVRARIERACADGGSSIHSTGSSPGFATEALLLPLLSLSRRLDCVTIDEFADLESRNSPALLFDVMGFGAPAGSVDQRKADHVRRDFAGSLGQIAAACGIAIDTWSAVAEVSAVRHDVAIAAGRIPAGGVAAQRVTVTGSAGGQARLRFRANWYCARAIVDADWDLRESGWRIRVEGDTPLDVTIRFPVAAEDYAAFTPGLTAHRAVNAVAAVCAAAPGIRTTADLPQVIARF